MKDEIMEYDINVVFNTYKHIYLCFYIFVDEKWDCNKKLSKEIEDEEEGMIVERYDERMKDVWDFSDEMSKIL